MKNKAIACLACAVVFSVWAANPWSTIIQDASAQSDTTEVLQQNAELVDRFNAALKQIHAEEWAQAEKTLQGLLLLYPRVQAIHVNLAAVLARRGQLEQAREVLLLGMQQDPVSASLYRSLSRVHGALAATAYTKALDSSSTVSRLKPLDLGFLEASAVRQKTVVNTVNPDYQVSPDVTSQLAALTTELTEARVNHQNAISKLNAQIVQQQRLLNQQADDIVALRLAAINKTQAEPNTLADQEPEAVSDDIEAATRDKIAATVSDDSAAETNALNSIDIEQRNRLAIQQVQAWARAWESRDIANYMSFYVDNYSPSQSVTHQDWLQQNQARFAGDDTVVVDVTDFVVSALGTQFAVTFKQHYRSKTFDQTVRKRLVFELQNGDWSSAKIVNEHAVSG